MKRKDYEEAILEHQPCAQLGTVLKFICDKHEISRMDFILLLELKSIDEFTWGDFSTTVLTANWDKHRWYRLKNEGYVEMYRRRDGKYRRFSLYKTTRKTTIITNEFYNYLSRAKEIPIKGFSTKAKYTANRLNNKLRALKEDNGTEEETKK